MHPIHSMRGVATLVMTVILLVVILAMSIFLVNFSSLQNQSTRNMVQSNQAYQAAEAGMQYGLSYLQQNSNVIKATASSGVINYSLPTTSLSDGSNFTVTYTNPTVSNYSLLEISSVGVSANANSTHTLDMQVYAARKLKYALTAKGALSISVLMKITGGAQLGNTTNYPGLLNVDGTEIVTLDAAYTGMTNSQFFQALFGYSTATQQAQSTYYSSQSAAGNLANLSGKVWIDGSVNGGLIGNVVLGSSANPVFLVINGNLNNSLVGNITAYGIVVVLGNISSLVGTLTVNGALVTTGSLTVVNGVITYNSTYVDNLLTPTYGQVPGSWRDY